VRERQCLTVVSLRGRSGHGVIPSWLVPGTPDFQRLVRRVGSEEVTKRRQVYLDGFTDVKKNWWCGGCYYHCLLINLGERLGYPDGLVAGPGSGYERWLFFARFAGYVAVSNVVDFLKREGVDA
jgi:hypothetical protein